MIRRRLLRVSGGRARGELALATLGLLVVVATVLVQAAARYFFEMGLAWPSEASRYVYIWSSFLGGAASVHYKEEIRVDLLDPLCRWLKVPDPERVALQVQRIGAFLAACFLVTLAALTWDYVSYEREAGLTSLILGVPASVVTVALLVTSVNGAFQ